MYRSEQADRNFQRVPVRWAALAAAFIATTTGWTQAQEAKPPQQTPETAPSVVLEADQVTADHDLIIAEGRVEARYEGRTLRADKLTYDTKKHTVHAEGRVEVIEDDGTVRFADEIEVDDKLSAGVATGFSTRLPGGGTAAAASAVLLPNGVKELNRAVYSACPVCDDRAPTWTLRARKAVQNPNMKMMSYRDVVLDVHGVPVLWLPYFSHPDPTAGRKSGFLLPDIGQSRRLGAFYAQPYYWAISPYSDLTIAPRVMANVNPLLMLKYRKRFWSGDVEIEGSGTYETDFDNDGNRFGKEAARGHIFAGGAFKIDDYWNWGFGIARASDDLYLKRYDIPESDNKQAGLYLSDLTRLFSHVNLTGQDDRSYANVSFMSVQGLRDGDSSANLPLVLPVGEYERSWRDPWLDGQFKLQASTANLLRGAGVNSSRISGGGEWQMERIVGPGLMLTPFAQGREDVYRVDNYTTTDPIWVSRTLGIAGAEVRWPFVRASRSGISYLVEPIMMAAIASSGGNDSRIPNEDSQSFELDDTGLFRPNGAPNYDLWQPGPRVSVGVRASAVTAAGTATAEFGRQWRAEAAPEFADVTNLNGKSSDYVGSISADLGTHFGGTLRLRLDQDTFQINRVDTSVRAKIGKVSGVVRYFDVDKSLVGAAPSQEIAGAVGVDVTKAWNVSYGLRRDLDSAINLSQNVGLTYRDNCTFVQFVYTHTETLDRTIGPSEGVQIRVGLSTLGVFGGGG